MVASERLNAVVVVLAIAAAGLVVFPGPAAEYLRSNKEREGQRNHKEKGDNSVWTLINLLRWIHVTGFATTFGSSLWVNFIGGIIMFKHLPRHQFGNLQGKLFPVFFRLSSAATAAEISIFAILHPFASSTVWERVQVGALGLALVSYLLNLLVLEPLVTKLMRARHKAEREDGISTEPGVARKKEIENASPELKAINKKFGAAHGISSLINLFGFWGLFAHLFYLAGRLSL